MKLNSQQKFILIFAGLVVLFLSIVVVNRELREQAVPETPVFVSRTPVTTDTPAKPVTTQTPQIPTTPLTPRATLPEMTPSPATSTTVTPEGKIQEYFVSPDGKEDGDGSMDEPWPLQFALSQPSQVKGGDIIWVRGGKYIGQFVLKLKGEEGKPIIVRAYPGERAILEHEDRVLDIASSSYVYLWGLEITATRNERNAVERRRSAYGVRVKQSEDSHDIKFINMIVHDVAAQGFGWWPANTDSEIYGSIIYYNGSHNQFDHGIYVNNINGTKKITDNIIFNNASHGIHAYGEGDQQLNNIVIVGNTVFNNGSIGYSTSKEKFGIYKRNILLGGHQIAQNPVVLENYTYYPGSEGVAFNLGYQAGSTNAIVEDNYFAGGEIEMGSVNTGIALARNTMIGSGPAILSGFSIQQFSFVSLTSEAEKIFVRANQYEEGRANITIYNWRHQKTITITAEQLKKVDLKAGDHFALHNAQDFFGDVVRGIYDGQSITISMEGRSVAQPLGLDFKPDSTFPEFGAFVLIRE